MLILLFPDLCTALWALSDLDVVISLLQLTNKSMAALFSSYEVMWANYYDFVLNNVSELQSTFDENFLLQ